jgi:hypothetical protein
MFLPDTPLSERHYSKIRSFAFDCVLLLAKNYTVKKEYFPE